MGNDSTCNWTIQPMGGCVQKAQSEVRLGYWAKKMKNRKKAHLFKAKRAHSVMGIFDEAVSKDQIYSQNFFKKTNGEDVSQEENESKFDFNISKSYFSFLNNRKSQGKMNLSVANWEQNNQFSSLG